MKIARISPLTYTPGELEYFSFIRTGSGADYHQNPTFYLYPNGDLMMYWFAYDFDECSNNCVLLYSISKDSGITWSDPQVYMADYPGGVPCIRMLSLKDTCKVLMFQIQTIMDELEIDDERRVATAGSDYFKSRTRVFLRRSTDAGRSFDHGVEVPYLEISGGKTLPGVGFYGAIDELIQLQNGRVLASFMYLDPDRCDTAKQYQHYEAACLLSDDGGESWKRSNGQITVDTPRGVMETQIVETAPNNLFCLFRTKGGYLYETRSEDGGDTWSESKPSPLPAPESMARMIKLKSGNLLVAWNSVSSTTQQPRHPMSASLSSDRGITWSQPRKIADESGSNQLSNHGLVQLDDGRILLALSHYHDIRPMTSDIDIAIFDEEWILGDKIGSL